ncbi:MAG: hypothetical protein SNJ73_06330 [Acetobacteraceae bacterium]
MALNRVAVALAALALAAAPARAQTSPTVLPAALQGLWIAGECAAPSSLLFASSRGWALLPTGGRQRLWRLALAGEVGGFTLVVADDPERTRLLMRAVAGGLEVREPPAKLPDAALPGESPATSFRRCPSIPASLAVLHGEGLSFLAALDSIEAACAGGEIPACLDALWAWADVTREGSLTAAELARLARGLAYVVMLGEGAESQELAAALGAGALGGVAIGWALIASFDYDGSATLTKAELSQDRVPVPGLAGAATAAPAASAPAAALSDQLGALRALLQELAPMLGLPGR